MLFCLGDGGWKHDGHELSFHEPWYNYISSYRSPGLDIAWTVSLSQESWSHSVPLLFNTVSGRQALYHRGFVCVYYVSYSTIQFKMCHFLKSTVFNWEGTWIASALLALLAHHCCKAEWQTRSLPHVKKCVVLFQYSFWSLIYLPRLKKITDRYVDSELLLMLALWGLSKKNHVWKVSCILKKKGKSEVRYNTRISFLKMLYENYPQSFNNNC